MDLISYSRVPKYAQIADIFRQRIARGIWAQGLRLPANESLAAEFGVSRVTIRLHDDRSDGHLSRRGDLSRRCCPDRHGFVALTGRSF
jgi:DNA-binding transcriptional MocR family regulator